MVKINVFILFFIFPKFEITNKKSVFYNN